MNPQEIIVIGGGAAGFFAAINCAELHPEYKITLLEKNSKLLSKVRVSGGGRCNVTHACFNNGILSKNYPRGEKELLPIFSRFNTLDTINWFEKRGVTLKTENDGRMFPTTDNSETIINCLMQQAGKFNITIKLNVTIEKINIQSDNSFLLNVSGGGTFDCNKLIIACGGNSKVEAYEWLKNLGHSIVKPIPSLFTFNIPNNEIVKLMGISLPLVKVKIADTNLHSEGALLITHWGFSGPAILKLSAWGARILNNKDYHFNVFINWLPKYSEEKLRIEFANQRTENPSGAVFANCPFDLPKRLWEYLLTKLNIQNKLRWADVSKKQYNALIALLTTDEYEIKGKTTFKEEFVTCGGIDLNEINLKTMQSKMVPNLFFAGEVINVDGITGGFNFQNAWSTAWLAAQNC